MMSRRTPRALLLMAHVYIVLLPLNGLSLYNFGERGLARVDWVCGAVLLIFFGVASATGRIQRNQSPVNKFVVLYVYLGLLSGANLFNGTNAQFIDFATKAVQLVFVGAVFFAISSLPLDEGELKSMLRTWFIVAFVVAVYGLYQAPARIYDWPFAYLRLNNPTLAPGGIQRGRAFDLVSSAVSSTRGLRHAQFVQVSSFFREPAWLGSYLLSAAIPFALLILDGKGHQVLFARPWVNWFFLGILIAALLLSVSLGTYVELAAVLVMMCLLQRFMRVKSGKFILVVLGVLLGASLLLSLFGIRYLQTAFFRIRGLVNAVVYGSSGGGSYTVRVSRTLAALAVWWSSPILGVGLNNVSHHTHVHIPAVNDGWTLLLSEMGLLGFAAMVQVLRSLLGALRHLSRRIDPTTWQHSLVIGFFFLLVADVVGTITTFHWTHTLRWFDLALANLVLVRVGGPVFGVEKKKVEQVRPSLDPP